MRMSGKKEYSLYVHIPFCKKKCDYCHFYVLPDYEESKDQLLKALKQHWTLWDQKLEGASVKTLYFGGGTPSLFGAHRIQEFIDWISKRLTLNCEISLEANPDQFTGIQSFRKAGVNRLSIGVQTLDDALLPLLGRTHSANQAIKTVEEAAHSFQNITIDLMYDLPHQTLESWISTLDQALRLPIQHVSLYNLILEPESLFYKKKKELSLLMPVEEISAEMYSTAIEKMQSNGFQQYEISAFAKAGYTSKHNSVYWKGEPFLGLGPSAFSYLDGKRFRQHRNLKKYCESVERQENTVDFEEQLDNEAAQRELLAVGLRMMEGIDLLHFPSLNQESAKEIEQLIKDGLLKQNDYRLQITDRGKLFYDTIARHLI